MITLNFDFNDKTVMTLYASHTSFLFEKDSWCSENNYFTSLTPFFLVWWTFCFFGAQLLIKIFSNQRKFSLKTKNLPGCTLLKLNVASSSLMTKAHISKLLSLLQSFWCRDRVRNCLIWEQLQSSLSLLTTFICWDVIQSSFCQFVQQINLDSSN